MIAFEIAPSFVYILGFFIFPDNNDHRAKSKH